VIGDITRNPHTGSIDFRDRAPLIVAYFAVENTVNEFSASSFACAKRCEISLRVG
jgi:hypothetical protein